MITASQQTAKDLTSWKYHESLRDVWLIVPQSWQESGKSHWAYALVDTLLAAV